MSRVSIALGCWVTVLVFGGTVVPAVGQVPEDPDVAYFKSLSARSDTFLAAALDSQADIDQYVAGAAGDNWVYDAAVGAAVGTVRADGSRDSDVRPQLRFPINQTDGTVTVVWESYKGPEWVGHSELPSKTFMLRDGDGDIYYEMRHHFSIVDDPDDLALVDVRVYGALGDGAYRNRVNADTGERTGCCSSAVQPIPQRTMVKHSQWTRFVVHVELDPGGFNLFSFWVLRADGRVLQVHDRVPVADRGGIAFLALHYDSSSGLVSQRAIRTFDRHVWIGSNVADVAPLLVPPGPSLLPPTNVRLVN